MYIKNKSKYLLIVLFINILLAGEYFSFSNSSDKKELILLCNDNIYYPMILTGHNLGIDTSIDIKIPMERTPRISTRYNNKYSFNFSLKNTVIQYNNSTDSYLKN